MVDEIRGKKICLFGPQGSGKGTQSEKITALFGVPQLSPGNIFRKAIADGTELGKEVEAFMTRGDLVPDEITNNLMRERLQQEDCLDGFVLDGYPRNLAQADALDSMTPLSQVILIDISDEEAVRRISQRRSCPNDGIVYHLESKPPVKADICDTCGGPLMQRDDDKPEAIRQRLAIYHSQTEPLLKRYDERGILCRVDGTGSIDAVWERTQECFF